MKKTVLILNPVCMPGIPQPGMVSYNGLTLAIPLLASGYRVKFVDLHWCSDPEGEILDEAASAVCVGISAMTGHQIKDGLRWAGRVRDRFPDLPIVWGGPHASILPEQTLRDPRVDHIVRGQGTYAFLDLVRALESGRDPSRIPGTGCRRDGMPVMAPARPFQALEGFSGYPFDLIDVERISAGAVRFVYNSSEGCPWRCSFCANQIMYGRRWAGFDADPLLSDLKRLRAQTGVRQMDMLDTNFFVRKRRVLEFAEALTREKADITWTASARSDQLLEYSADEMRLLAESGLTGVLVGMESGSRRVLELMMKDIDVEDCLRGVEHLSAHGIHTTGLFMMGLPTETEEEREATRRLILQINGQPHASALVAVFTPYPGESLYQLCLQHGFEPPDSLEGWSEFSQDKANLPWIGDDFKWEHDRFIAGMKIAKEGASDSAITRRIEEMLRAGHRRILVWGAGLTAARIILACRDTPLEIAGLVDSNPKKWNREWYGHRVEDPDRHRGESVDGLLIGSSGYETEILERLRESGGAGCPVWTIGAGQVRIVPEETT